MKSLLIMRTLGVFALLIGCNAMASGDEDQIKRQIAKYENALNKSDVPAILDLYGQEPIFMPQGSNAQVGREEVKRAYEGVFKAIELKIKFSVYEVEAHGSTAWARTSSAGKTKINANGIWREEGNNELFIFKKEKGTWKIHRYLFSTNKTNQ